MASSRVAVVTGAARGIGRAVALLMAQDGCDLVLHDRDEAELLRTAGELAATGVTVEPVVSDLADVEGARGVVRCAQERFGRLDALVCNAGTGWLSTLAEFPVERWDHVLAVNLRAPFLLAQAALAPLEASGSGTIVTIASTAVTGLSRQVAYDASKGGLVTLTRSLAVELGPRGIRANAVCPGLTDTRMGTLPAMAELAAKTLPTLPIPRMGAPEEIAEAVRFLASPDAAYITGQTLFVDGGWVRA